MVTETPTAAPVLYDVHITDTATGETRVVPFGHPWYDHSGHWWSEGNYGCDCNRAGVFGNPDEDFPCGDTRYRVRCVERGTGRVLYDDSR